MVYLQRWHGWCHIKLLPSRRKFCVHHTTMHHVTSCKATYVMCVCLAVTCHLHFWQNDRDLSRATAVTDGGGTDTEIRVSTKSRPRRRKFSRRSCRDSNPRPFNHESGALTTELSPPRDDQLVPSSFRSPTQETALAEINALQKLE